MTSPSSRKIKNTIKETVTMSETKSSIEKFQKSIGGLIKDIPVKSGTNKSVSYSEMAKLLKRLSEI